MATRRGTYKTLVPAPSLTVPGDIYSATHVAVEVYYSKGGTNLFSGNGEPRGFWLSANPVSIGPAYTGAPDTESFMIGDRRGTRIFLTPAARANDRALATLAARVTPHADAIGAAIASGNKHLAATIARSAAVGEVVAAAS